MYIYICRGLSFKAAIMPRALCPWGLITASCDRWAVNFNTLRPRQNGRRFADDIFKCIFLKENVWISLNISLKYIPKVPFNNIPTSVQIMAWCRPGDKPLSEPMMVNLLTHICVTRPQWVNRVSPERTGQTVCYLTNETLWVVVFNKSVFSHGILCWYYIVVHTLVLPMRVCF